MFFVIFWTALVRYTWLSNSSRFFFPTISTFGCFWSQWPTSLAVTSGREGVRTTSFKPWRPHRGSCRGATAIEENNGSRRERCGAGGCRREATWININHPSSYWVPPWLWKAPSLGCLGNPWSLQSIWLALGFQTSSMKSTPGTISASDIVPHEKLGKRLKMMEIHGILKDSAI